MDLFEALKFCKVVKISDELAFQYHNCDSKESFYLYLPQAYYSLYNKTLRPNLVKALVKNTAGVKFIFAILAQDLDIVKQVLVNSGDGHGIVFKYNPLRLACRYGQLDVVKLLVNDYGFDISAHRNAALCEACECGHVDILNYILSHQNFDQTDCSRALIKATEYGQSFIIRVLLKDDRFDPSYQNNAALKSAVQEGHIEIIKLLLADPRCNPTDQDAAIYAAADEEHFEIVRLFLSDPRLNRRFRMHS